MTKKVETTSEREGSKLHATPDSFPKPPPPVCPPLAGRPPSLTFSHMLQKSETVIKAISNVYSGDVQYKAETWYLLLTDKWNVLAVAGWGRGREAGESLLLFFRLLIEGKKLF